MNRTLAIFGNTKFVLNVMSQLRQRKLILYVSVVHARHPPKTVVARGPIWSRSTTIVNRH